LSLESARPGPRIFNSRVSSAERIPVPKKTTQKENIITKKVSENKMSKKKQSVEPVKVRTEFPETWLWIDEKIRLVYFFNTVQF